MSRIESNYQNPSFIIKSKPDWTLEEKNPPVTKPVSSKNILDDFEIGQDDEFDRQYNDLTVIQAVLKLFIAQAKTLQKKMESDGTYIKKLNELQQAWTNLQTKIKQFSPDDFIPVLGSKPEDAQKRQDMANKMNEASDRFRDLIRVNRDQVKDEAQRSQSALQTTVDERMKMYDNFSKMIGDLSMIYSMLFKG